MDIEHTRENEIRKYRKCYESASYKMGVIREMAAIDMLVAAPSRESYLDVGCGRGEMLDHAHQFGFQRCAGVETVLALTARSDVHHALGHCLPFADAEFDIVSCFDVLEHLVPEDTIPVLHELDRVAGVQLILTTNNQASTMAGMDLHINIRSYDEWDTLIREHCSGRVIWHPRSHNNFTETWTVTKPRGV